ncbi:beta-lactamase family protein [Actinoplanes hulinensis]|uniref:Beta-lactamase family protein n=1 Tax=Actinoplanes hulinensis TaxID=1144547 RepID=A0ABS7B2C1_9ACTN|nr:serine hydrolase domain-containing protein [Actinoplanes hulinensis]MBW6435012.1 beta-lactamase family protein [Actinoplanes hulinensis]
MRRVVLSMLVAATLGLAAPASAAEAGCAPSARPHGTAATIVDIARAAERELGLSATIVRVTVGGREVVTAATGQSMAGVPATTGMRFRTGAVGITYLTVLLLRLADQGAVDLDEPIARWYPELPRADKVTLRMLGSSTSGYPDYVTYQPFIDRLYADPFQRWTEQQLIDIALARPLWYEPGTNWSYSHANFVILGRILQRVTGTPLDRLTHRHIVEPLGLTTTISTDGPVIPGPVLHAYTTERGRFEDSTYWNPSWTTAHGAILTSDICDLATSASAVGTGRLLSARAQRTLLDPGTVGLGGPTKTCPATICVHHTEQRHYGLGIDVEDGWIKQTPSFAGYSAVQAYLPGRDIAIAVAATRGRTTTEVNAARTIADRIATLLTGPDNP